MSPSGRCAAFLLLSLLWASAVALRFENSGVEEPGPRTPGDAGANEEAEDDRELPDDALQVLPPPPLSQNETSSESAQEGRPPLFGPKTSLPRCRQAAQAWQLCPAWAKVVPHTIDSVASLKGKFLYVDNVKAASTSLQNIINEVVGMNWRHTDVPHDDRYPHACGGRLSTAVFAIERLASLFVFSFVRDPVKKFESGVRQTWANHPVLRRLTADELLDMQLGLSHQLTRPVVGGSCQQNWVDQHLQPSSWRLSAQGMDGKALHFDCVGQTETFDDDWGTVLSSMANISRRDLERLSAIGKANVREHDPRSKLSPQAIRRMCQSWVYGHEWDCFGYPRPAVCQ